MHTGIGDQNADDETENSDHTRHDDWDARPDHQVGPEDGCVGDADGSFCRAIAVGKGRRLGFKCMTTLMSATA